MGKNKKKEDIPFDFSDVEDKIQEVQDVIEKAVNSRNYQEMSQSITRMVNNTLNQYKKEHPEAVDRSSEAARDQNRAGTKAPIAEKEAVQKLYFRSSGEQVKYILFTVFGGILTGTMTIGFLTVQLVWFALDSGSGSLPLGMFAGIAAGAGLLTVGIRGLGRVSRFKKYIKALGMRTYCQLDRLAREVRRPVRFVKKDIKKMIGKGWFLEGSLDRKETCLITSRETYAQYEQMERALEEKTRQEEQNARERAELSPEVQEVLKKGEAYLEKLRKSNDAIPGEEISQKIYKMEKIVDQIFQRAKEHPEIIPDLKRMMDYYLPMTVKLLDAYEDMDSQPVQGETIRSSKKEIEDTLDTLNEAFAKLLDSVFQDTAWDVSSDISVLHTLLAQEGLKESDFKIHNGK